MKLPPAPRRLAAPAVCAALAFAPRLDAGPPAAAPRPVPAATARAAGDAPHEMLDAVLWQQSSGEYEAAARQVYAVARVRLDEALADPTWTAAIEQTADYGALPPAVMLDLDETVLDNTRYEARIVLRYGEFSPATFAAWCREGGAGAVPGARDFLRYAERRGVAVFYFSARGEGLRGCTAATLRRLDLPAADRPGRLLLRDGRDKSAHRREIARSYRILLLVGDSLEDFAPIPPAAPARRRIIARARADRWGQRWLIVPNPMYGGWEAAHYGFDRSVSRRARLQRKRAGLAP